MEYESSDIFIYENGNVVVYKDEEGEYISFKFDENLSLTKSILGEKYDVYKALKDDEFYLSMTAKDLIKLLLERQ